MLYISVRTHPTTNAAQKIAYAKTCTLPLPKTTNTAETHKSPAKTHTGIIKTNDSATPIHIPPARAYTNAPFTQ
ncbi:MAG: hypothetical protein WCK46_03300 [Candidatus Adlerbacteria bacterium]